MYSNNTNEQPATLSNVDHIKRDSYGMSWSAIFGGALGIITISFLLLILGVAFGLSSVSPWSTSSVTVFTAKMAIWFIVMQWLSAAFGGYLAGRLRVKCTHTAEDEVFFRDTAQGFLAWATATVFTICFMASAAAAVIGGAASIVGSGAQATASVAGQALAQKPDIVSKTLEYYSDTLFRAKTSSASAQDVSKQAQRILENGFQNKELAETDKEYLGRLVASHTGLSPEEATKRVDAVLVQINETKETMKQGAEVARKASLQASFFLFFSLLIGAFIACVAGVLGGRHRDAVE